MINEYCNSRKCFGTMYRPNLQPTPRNEYPEGIMHVQGDNDSRFQFFDSDMLRKFHSSNLSSTKQVAGTFESDRQKLVSSRSNL